MICTRVTEFHRVKYTRDKSFIIAVGKKVREVRKQKKLSQQKLADLCNLELSQINRIELGLVNTSISHIACIADAFEIHPKNLLDVEIKKAK